MTEALACDGHHQRQPTALPIGPDREIAATACTGFLPAGETATLGSTAPTWGTWRSSLETLDPLVARRGRRTAAPPRLPHGDWTLEHGLERGEVLEVRDWERYATDLPQGFDVVHFAASSVRAHEPGDAEQRFPGPAGPARRLYLDARPPAPCSPSTCLPPPGAMPPT
ncbi:MAG: hypothetical protein U0R78_00580 [Nocardioidaceae bacterium]